MSKKILVRVVTIMTHRKFIPWLCSSKVLNHIGQAVISFFSLMMKLLLFSFFFLSTFFFCEQNMNIKLAHNRYYKCTSKMSKKILVRVGTNRVGGNELYL